MALNNAKEEVEKKTGEMGKRRTKMRMMDMNFNDIQEDDEELLRE